MDGLMEIRTNGRSKSASFCNRCFLSIEMKRSTTYSWAHLILVDHSIAKVFNSTRPEEACKTNSE